MIELATAYQARRILAAKYAVDMRHIALATIAAVDALVSWNFKHIVRLRDGVEAAASNTLKRTAQQGDE